jgi:hypothetical protein
LVVDALDVFALPDGVEWVVGRGEDGELSAQPVEPRATLRPAMQSQLAFHENGGRQGRVVPARTLHLFEAQMIEHTPDLPGVNDPVLLHGTLLGPFGDRTAAAARTPGHLTTTRGDLLHGLVKGGASSFLHADRLTGKSTRTLHALLPADREERLRLGYGAVLAYPCLDVGPGLVGPGNEAVVDEMLYGVLAAVWRDVAREWPPPAREADTLPVPSRAAHEWRLTEQGFTIEGDEAVRRRPGAGWRSLFSAERLRLPPQGHTDVFLALAQEALQLLPWAPPRIDALGALVPVSSAAPPASSPMLPPGAPTPRPGLSSMPATVREDWLRRFIEAQDERARRRSE